MRFSGLLFLFLFLLLSPVSAAATAQNELEHFLQTIQDRSDQISSFTTDFIQEKKLSLFADSVLFRGNLSIVRPDQLRWEFTFPVASVLILTGDHGIRCNDTADPERFQLSRDPVMKMVAKQLWLWLGGDYKKLNRHHRLETTGPYTLLITPQNQSTADYIESVTIVFDEKTLQPLQVEMREQGGDSTRISFHSSIVNAEIPEKLFTDCIRDE